MATRLQITGPDHESAAQTRVLVGTRAALRSDVARARLAGALSPELLDAMIASLSPDEDSDVTTTWAPDGCGQRVALCAVDDRVSRANTASRPYAMLSAIRKGVPAKGDVVVDVLLDDASHALAAAVVAGRAFPQYRRRSGADSDRTVTVRLVPLAGTLSDDGLGQIVADAVRHAADLVDRPTSELHTDALVSEAREVAARVGASIQVIQGEDLVRHGLGGLVGVGKAAEHGPALVVLTHAPEGATRTWAWVGKGIVYDTGGLSLKGKSDMPGMKSDMGGAAAVLCAFEAAARSGASARIHAVLCLAENSVGPNATRPDDILTMYSGRTVEVNNTDAEGRLVLADGVAWASKHLAPDAIVDMATLTGAQLMATGRRHAAVVCNDEALEAAAVLAGRASGDLVHPLPYCPEFYIREFRSKVADMKNSVKDRMNAQTSCAAQFVAEHLSGYTGPWLHVDMAGPAREGDRATGWGVGLLIGLLRTA